MLHDIALDYENNRSENQPKHKSINAFSAEDTKKARKWAHRFWQQLGTKSPFLRAWFGDWRAHDTGSVRITEAKHITADTDIVDLVERGNFENKDTGWNVTVVRLGIDGTISHSGREGLSKSALSEISTLISNSVLLDTEVSLPKSGKKHKETAFEHKLYSIVRISGKDYIAKIAVEEYGDDSNSGKRFYNLKAIKMSPTAVEFYSQVADIKDIISISNLFALVKEYDSEFKPREVDPVLLNEDGTPKIFHHGTRKGGFTAFREWSYWTENEKYARRYTDQAAGNTVYDAYLTADKVFDTRDPECRRIFEEEYSGNYCCAAGNYSERQGY